MPREAEPSLNERTFVIDALKEGNRLDGRAFDQFRQLDLKFGDQYGVADVTLGKTRYGLF
jgi:exosome complex component RRP45